MSLEQFRSINIKTNQVEPLRGVKQRSLFQVGRAYTAPEVLKNVHHELPYRIKLPMMLDASAPRAHDEKPKMIVDSVRRDESQAWCTECFGPEAFAPDEQKYYFFTRDARWAKILFWYYFRRPEDLTLYQLRWRDDSIRE